MATINLAEADVLQSASIVPLVYSLVDHDGKPVSEPWFDYDDDGNPTDFGIDEEPPDPTADDLLDTNIDLLAYNVSPSEFAETAIRVPEAGAVSDFRFEGREYLRRIYDTPADKVLLKCGRQVEKSTTLGNRLLCYSALTNNFRCLFVAPSAEQAKVFSNDRLKDVIEASPLIKAYTSSKINQAVFFKKLINFSQIRLRYAYLTADRVRGIPADLIEIDEIQDILIDNIPIIEQCAFHSKYKLFIYSGTPKSNDNTIEKYWTEFSTQNEWVVPCDRHGTPKDPTSWHWNVLDEKNIGQKGLICDKCKQEISARDPRARWAALQPIRDDNKERVTFEGYRIPQIMVPWVDWQEVLEAQEQYSRAQFMNEKLGLSYDSGTRPITRAQVKACCQPHIRLGDIESLKKVVQGKEVYCGIDWGCHDDQTRILTQDGWKYFKDLDDGDRVAQWDPDTREMSLVEPEVRTVKEWDGPLYHFETKGGLDMMLTGTHRMRVGHQVLDSWKTEPAEQTVARGGNIKFVGHVNWVGTDQSEFTLPGLPKSPGYAGSEDKVFVMEDWLEFLGYVLSEGGVCLRPSKPDPNTILPYCIKMSQRETASPETSAKIKECLERARIPYAEYPNTETGDLNWTISGKQYWHWFAENMGYPGDQKRIPRQFLDLPPYQLWVLFDAMVAGDGYEDPRDNCTSGAYYSTSKGLCEDFQELCIRLGMRCVVRLHKPAEGNRKTRWRAMWSLGRDYQFNTPCKKIKTVPYTGKVYCCKVPSGYIVTERNGCVAYQGNTGENTYTVISFGTYLSGSKDNFSIFWIHRFTGQDLDPDVQLDKVAQMIAQMRCRVVGVDYGGGFWQNDRLIKQFGPNRVVKFQYNPKQKKKVYWEEHLLRYMVHRSEVMSDIFAAFKDRKVDFPCWNDFIEPHASDILNIFSEYNERQRMIEYKKAPGKTDDAFHSILYCMLGSMIVRPRPDIITPMKQKVPR
jgi:hypothetical protein